MNPTIAIIGCHGQLGTDLLKAAARQQQECVGLDFPEIDIADSESVDRVLGATAPAVVINTAAAHSAAVAERHNQEAFFQVNALGPWHLARWCERHSALLIHYSTDYVYGIEALRAAAYLETDAPCPTNIYGASKVAGEQLVRASCRRHYILRVASLYGSTGCRAKGNSNFVLMTLKKSAAGENMRVVTDQWMSPTWTMAAARKTLELLRRAVPPGMYHLAGSGSCTWHGFASEIVRLSGGRIAVEPSATAGSGGAELYIRPRYTALDNHALRQCGVEDLPPWQEALAEFLRDIGKSTP